MSYTSYAVNDALAVKLWAKELIQAERDVSEITKLEGESADSIIHVKSDLSKGKGDQVTFALRARLSGDGFSEADTAEGNGEAITTFSQALVINELGNNVGVKSPDTIDAQRVNVDLRSEAKDGLRDWFKDRKSITFFNHVCGNTVANTVTVGSGGPKFSGFNTIVAPSSDRQVWAGTATNDQGLTSGDTFTTALIEKAVEKAKTGTNMIRPVYVGGQPKYVLYIDVAQQTSLRTNTATNGWLDITKFALSVGYDKSNPIYTGAIGEYANCVIRSSQDISLGVNSSTGAAVANTRRAVLLGAQAAAIGYGARGNGGKSRYRWSEMIKDHGRKLEVSAWSIFGMTKCRFNSSDFGTMVLSTYAARA